VSSVDEHSLTARDADLPATIANALGTKALARKLYARVSMTLYFDAGRTGQLRYTLGILTPKPVINVTGSSSLYSLSVGSGHFLNPDGTNNVIVVTHLDPDAGVAANIIQFDLVLDGKILASDPGKQLYVFALVADGPHVYNSPAHTDSGGNPVPASDTQTWQGLRPDLHAGNEADSASTVYPDGDVWVRSRVEDVDITLVGKTLPVAPRGKEGKKTAKFS
jgi:hypothetical protein